MVAFDVVQLLVHFVFDVLRGCCDLFTKLVSFFFGARFQAFAFDVRPCLRIVIVQRLRCLLRGPTSLLRRL